MVGRHFFNDAKNTLFSSVRRGIVHLKTGQSAASPMPLGGPGESLRDRLAHDFDRARFGTHFRSLTFPVAAFPGEREYYKAVATSPDLRQWTVQCHRTRPYQLANTDLPIDQPTTGMVNVYQNLTFFRALEIVATFEAVQVAPSIGLTRDDMGANHYRAFAILHQIGLDIHGIPQPTQSGHIMVPGQYPADQPDYIAPPIAEMQMEWQAKATIAASGTIAAFAQNFSKLVTDRTDFESIQRSARWARFYLELSQVIHQSPARVISSEDAECFIDYDIVNKDKESVKLWLSRLRFRLVDPQRFLSVTNVYRPYDNPKDHADNIERHIRSMVHYVHHGSPEIMDQIKIFFGKIYTFNFMQDIKFYVGASAGVGASSQSLGEVKNCCVALCVLEQVLTKSKIEHRVDELMYQAFHEPIATEIPADLIAFCEGLEAMVAAEAKKLNQNHAAIVSGGLAPS